MCVFLVQLQGACLVCLSFVVCVFLVQLQGACIVCLSFVVCVFLVQLQGACIVCLSFVVCVSGAASRCMSCLSELCSVCVFLLQLQGACIVCLSFVVCVCVCVCVVRAVGPGAWQGTPSQAWLLLFWRTLPYYGHVRPCTT